LKWILGLNPEIPSPKIVTMIYRDVELLIGLYPPGCVAMLIFDAAALFAAANMII
jgi:hypothetical protein